MTDGKNNNVIVFQARRRLRRGTSGFEPPPPPFKPTSHWAGLIWFGFSLSVGAVALHDWLYSPSSVSPTPDKNITGGPSKAQLAPLADAVVITNLRSGYFNLLSPSIMYENANAYTINSERVITLSCGMYTARIDAAYANVHQTLTPTAINVLKFDLTGSVNNGDIRLEVREGIKPRFVEALRQKSAQQVATRNPDFAMSIAFVADSFLEACYEITTSQDIKGLRQNEFREIAIVGRVPKIVVQGVKLEDLLSAGEIIERSMNYQTAHRILNPTAGVLKPVR